MDFIIGYFFLHIIIGYYFIFVLKIVFSSGSGMSQRLSELSTVFVLPL